MDAATPPVVTDQHGQPIDNPAVLLVAGLRLLARDIRLVTDAAKALGKAKPAEALAMLLADEATRAFELAMQLAPAEYKAFIGRKIESTLLNQRPVVYRTLLKDAETDKLTGESVSFQMTYAEAAERFGLPPE